MPQSRKWPTGKVWSFAAIFACIVMAGCGSVSPRTVRVTQDADTDIVAGDHIAIILSRYRRKGFETKELEPVEAWLEECIRTELKAVYENLMFLPPDAFRKLLSMESAEREAFKSPKASLRALAEPVTAARLADAKLRYVVLLDASYTTSPAQLDVEGSSGALVITSIWAQDSLIEATILDVKHVRVTGSVRTRLIGEEGAGVGIVVIIPVPVYFTSMTESNNCKALGKELTVFFNYRE